MAPSPREEENSAMVLTGRLYPPARERLCTLFPGTDETHNGLCGPGGTLAAVNMEGPLASIWAREGATPANGLVFGGRTPPSSAPLCHREKVDEVPLQIQRDQRPHQEPRRNSEENDHYCPRGEKVVPEGGLPLCSFPSGRVNQHPLHRQHQQSQHEVPSYPAADGRQGYGQSVGMDPGNLLLGMHRRSNCQQQERGKAGQAMDGCGDSGKATGDDRSGGLHCGGGGSSGCCEMAGGESVTASPKRSVSSDASWAGGGGDRLLGNGPAAMWELDSTGEGDGGPPGERNGKRKVGTVAEHGVGLQQPQTIWLRDSSPSLRDEVQQSTDELQKLLLCNIMKLKPARTSAKEEIRKKEKIMQLLQLLKMSSLERDARELLQELLNKIAQSSPLEHPPSLSYSYPEDPSVQSRRCKFDVTDSDTLSFTQTQQLYSCSPAQPLSDMISTTELHNVRNIPDSSNIAVSQQPLLSEYRNHMTMELSTGMAKLDRASAMIDRLVVKKPLPEKGKLLQAVMEAGPLLRTLLVAGPLPQWRNPPPLKPFVIPPPVSVKARKLGTSDQNALLNPNYLVRSSAKAFHCQNSLVASRPYAAPSMKPSSLSALCMRVPMLSTCASSCKPPFGKRQKI